MTEFKEGKPCKRCGGTKRYASGSCLSCHIAYRPNYRSNSLGHGKTGDIGYAGELLVRVDLLMRGLDVTVPENRSSPDDVHFLSSVGWVSVQVKTPTVNRVSGTWTYTIRKTVTSDVLAWVDLRLKEIRYRPNTKPVPPELLE